VAAVVPIEELVAAPRATTSPAIGSVLLRNRNFMVGAGLFLTIVVLAIVISLLLGAQPLRPNAFRPKLGPGTAGALLGTTTLGQSVFAQLMQAIPRSCLVGLLAAAIGTTVGATIGLLGGYFGGAVDGLLNVVVAVFLVVP
jgi:peptide/nickel transport system permease protein